MILVLGATGYIGRYLCPYLKEKGYDVLALGRSQKVQKFFEEQHVPFQYFDIREQTSFDRLPCENVDAIICLSACLAEHETPVRDFFEVNTLGVYNVLEFAKKNHISKVVITSTHKVYNDLNKQNGEPISENDPICFTGDHSPYTISKIAAENFVEYYNKDFGMRAIALRLTGVHGYGEVLGSLAADGTYKKSTFEIFFEQALKGEEIHVWGDQSIRRDHVYIKDVLSAIEASMNAAEAKGIFNIASGVGHSQYEEACALADVLSTGTVSKVVCNPDKPGLTRGYVYNIEKAERELNWQPKYIDLKELYSDYKREWESKKYHNYHFIRDDQKPMTF